MLKIHAAQVAAFAFSTGEGFAAELVPHCRDTAPQLCRTLRGEQVLAAVQQGVAEAKRRGFWQRGTVRFYVDMTITLGAGFVDDPQYPWATEIMDSGDYRTAMDRAEALHRHAAEFLARADGEDNVYAWRALAELATVLARPLAVATATRERDILRLLAQVHPRKVEATGQAPLERLIASAVARCERHGFSEPRSLAVMAMMAFVFGDGFAADPWLPWAAQALRASPQEAPERLERGAVEWLQTVLRDTRGEA